jgi:tetratricopeptide (TPR) repeat protein
MVKCLVFILIIFTSFSDQQNAYKRYYLGSLEFSEGRFETASRHFEVSYQITPTNFTFSLAYSLSLALSQKPEAAEPIIKKMYGMNPEAYDLALLSLLEGIVFTQKKNYSAARTSFQHALKWEENGKSEELHSTVYNYLGYLDIVDQGMSAHRKGGIYPHFHVHKRDLEKAYQAFEKAIQLNPSSISANTNLSKITSYLNTESQSINSNLSMDIGTPLGVQKAIIETIQPNLYDEIIFLLDITGSMVMENVPCRGLTRFDVMKEIAAGVYDMIPDHVKVGLGTIDGDCGRTPKYWFDVEAQTRRAYRQTLRFLIPDGTTPLLERLIKVPELFSGNSARRAIFLVSDGADTCPMRKTDICEWAEKIKEEGVVIHTLSFLDPNSVNATAFSEYTCLADKTGGKVLYLDNYRCTTERFSFDLIGAIQKNIPDLEPTDCWGPAVKDLWLFYPEKKI